MPSIVLDLAQRSFAAPCGFLQWMVQLLLLAFVRLIWDMDVSTSPRRFRFDVGSPVGPVQDVSNNLAVRADSHGDVSHGCGPGPFVHLNQYSDDGPIFGNSRVYERSHGLPACDFPDTWTPCSESFAGDAIESGEAAVGDSTAASSLGDANVQPTLSSTRHDAMFSRSLFSNCDFTGIKMPWEVGIYKELFDDVPSVEPEIPRMEISSSCGFGFGVEPQTVAEKVAEVAMVSDSNPVFKLCISCGDGRHFEERRANLRDAAIGKLMIVLRHCLLASVTGRHIIALGTEDAQALGAKDIVDAVVGVRSPSTILKRANSLLSFLRWFARSGCEAVNPFQEEYIWKYLQFLKATDAAPTRAESTLSAFRFAFHVLGFESLSSTMQSRRLVGLSEIMLTKKRLLRQAMVLTVTQVKGLHAALVNHDLHIMDRAVVGFILFSLYGR